VAATRLARTHLELLLDFAGALESLAEAVTVDRANRANNRKLILLACDANIARQDGAGAVANCTTAIQMQPNNADAYMKRAKAQEVLEEWQQVIRVVCGWCADFHARRSTTTTKPSSSATKERSRTCTRRKGD
jgi:tetratricopeptide (TPR) repeat protein